MIKKAFTVLHVKAVDADQRIIRGIATTPRADRVGDVVDPMGLQFKNPAPLLWHHDQYSPVGTVNFGKPTPEGIPFEARIPEIDAPSQLKARVDEAWVSVKTGLVACVSIGFNALEWSVNELTGGLNFIKSELLELSLVTIPANPDAVITGIKSMDMDIRAALGQNGAPAAAKSPSGVTETKTKSIRLTPKEANKTMTIAEQIKNFKADRAAKIQKMNDIMAKSTDATLAEADATEYDDLNSDILEINKHLDRLENLQKAQMIDVSATTQDATDVVKTAPRVTAVKDVQNEKDAAAARQNQQIRLPAQTEKGIGFARLAKCKYLAKAEHMPASQIAEELYGKEDPRIARVLKANMVAATTTGTSWAKPLVGDETSIFADFVDYLRPMTILGRFGQGGIPGLRRVPFRVPLITQTGKGSAYWVGEGKPKPVTQWTYGRTTLSPLKVATITVATMELLRDSSPSADALFRDELAAAVAERLDIDFIDPTKASSAGVSPASITYGVTPIHSSGSDADAIRCDINALLGRFIAANNPPNTGVLIMSSITALRLSTMRNPLGQAEFPGLTMAGGMLEGLPVITSEYVPSDTAGGYVFLINAGDVYLGDEGEVSIDVSDQASLQMLDNPTNDSVTPTPTSLVSLWQTNSVGFRAERTINWKKRRDSAVAVLDQVNWGDCNT